MPLRRIENAPRWTVARNGTRARPGGRLWACSHPREKRPELDHPSPPLRIDPDAPPREASRRSHRRLCPMGQQRGCRSASRRFGADQKVDRLRTSTPVLVVCLPKKSRTARDEAIGMDRIVDRSLHARSDGSPPTFTGFESRKTGVDSTRLLRPDRPASDSSRSRLLSCR